MLSAQAARQLDALQPFSDVTLRSSDGVEFACHKAILAGHCMVLRCAAMTCVVQSQHLQLCQPPCNLGILW